MKETNYIIHGVNGPVVTVVGGRGLAMHEMVMLGDLHLTGEVVRVEGGTAVVQVYEDTTGLAPGQAVFPTGGPLNVELGPGLLTHIFDGIARPLKVIEAQSGPFISRGLNLPALNHTRKWEVTMALKTGDPVQPGTLYASCPETTLILHRCLTPAGLSGTVTWAAESGSYTVEDPLLKIQDAKGSEITLKLSLTWPVRTPRPYTERLPVDRPLVTGQRVIDTLFPIAKGGAAAIPGPFGAGKTMTQHQLAKWSDADIIVYLGCGERGNEMTEVVDEFAKLLDPKSQQPLMNRTILIANTSNMPVAAREASVYTGMTIAEYFRDMGYHVALMADSTSRWAEALREISGRLEEMPAEEGFPAYLSSRLAEFYERAGYMRTLERQGGLRHRHRRRVAPGRRFLRARHPEYQAVCPGLLGAGPRSGLCPALPRHQLDDLLLRVRGGAAPLVRQERGPRVRPLPPADHRAAPRGVQADGDRQAHRLRRAAGGPEAHHRDRPDHSGGLFAAERVPCHRHLRAAGQATGHDAAHAAAL
jgi:V/A-type H+-transporting ATPase subunit A